MPPPSACQPDLYTRLKVGLAQRQGPGWQLLLPSCLPGRCWCLLEGSPALPARLCCWDVEAKGEFLLPAPLPRAGTLCLASLSLLLLRRRSLLPAER